MKNHNEQSGQNGPDCAAATHNTQAKDSEIKSRAYPFVEGYALIFCYSLKNATYRTSISQQFG